MKKRVANGKVQSISVLIISKLHNSNYTLEHFQYLYIADKKCGTPYIPKIFGFKKNQGIYLTLDTKLGLLLKVKTVPKT